MAVWPYGPYTAIRLYGHTAIRELVAPRRPEEQLSPLAPLPVAHDDDRVAEQSRRHLHPAALVQAVGRHGDRLARREHAPHVVARHHLELEHPRRPQQRVAQLHHAQDLARSLAPGAEVAAPRPV